MLFFQRPKRPLIFMVHGFGSRLASEFDELDAFLKEHQYPTMRFNIYDVSDDNDSAWNVWIRRCEEKMKEALAQNEQVVVIGFSMGGVIASYLASIYPVQSLILVAPAFQFLDYAKIEQASVNKIRSIISSASRDHKGLGSSQTRCFMDIISHFKDSIEHVSCPVLILHGLDDEIIPLRSSRKAYERIGHSRKRMLFIADGRHRMLYDGQVEPVCFALILDWLEGKLI